MRSLGGRVGTAHAAHLLGRKLASSTQASYQHHWEAVRAYCLLDKVSSLPATPVTVACYVGHLYGKGTMRGGSLRPYLAAIGSQHRRFGLPDPVTDPMVAATGQGYVANDAARSGGPPRRVAPLPAPCALHALQLALRAVDAKEIQRWGLVALGFLVCSRPTSIRVIRRCDLQFGAGGLPADGDLQVWGTGIFASHFDSHSNPLLTGPYLPASSQAGLGRRET